MHDISEPVAHISHGSRLQYFPISFFAMIMGLSGFSIAWRAAGTDLIPQMSAILGGIASVLMALVTLLYAIKALRYPSALKEEFQHPVRLNFFPAFSISLMLLSVVWHDYPSLCQWLWLTGVTLHVVLTLYVMGSWIHHTHYTLAHANPSWFIPVVGNIIAPISGTALGYGELSWFLFSIGIVFWLILLTIVLYRLFFHDPLPLRLTPMLFILLAPPSVGFISYTALAGGLDNFGRVLYYIALFLGMLLASNILRFIKVPFFLSCWAYSFPLAALTIATAKMGKLLPGSIFYGLSQMLLILLSVIILWLAVKTLRAVMAGKICKPE
ncbi:SLAC1 anion channel family protein [Shewanella sp. YIC-542]|uniref:SLAC1 anion channel family protein n=1 Tax=Shewanella mytili TaxID=3377111 RepID=UPI00398E3CD3